MSIDTKHQNSTQITATASTSDPKGRGKEKEVDSSGHEDMSDPEESGNDTRAEYPFEQFPLPPGDKSRNARVPSTTASLDSPRILLRYPPLSPLADDPTWHTQMVATVHRNRTRVNTQLELARTEAAKALADVTLAEVELKAERDKMQYFLNRVGSVAGKNFVRKMIREVERSLKTFNEKPDNHYEEEPQDYSDYEDSSGSDEGEVDHQDAEEEDLDGDAGKSEEGPQDAENSHDGSRKTSESPTASCSPSSLDCSLHESFREGKAYFWESSEIPPADESPNSSLQGISHQPNSPNWRRGDVADDEYSSGEDETSRKWIDLSPSHKSCKRHLEVEDDEESDRPGYSPQKKFKETPALPPLKDVELSPVPTRCFYPPEKKQAKPIDQDHHDDSDEENEVENSLTLEHEPVSPWPYLPQLNRLERDPFRVRQNSRGEPELYVPGRLAIELP
ncbi:hypothetical protein BDR07DRAFT_1494845 [Suillus spraguei]|nr:hypothetical protein BDR07DRAFT_1494845 [Suillus spraguei]